MEAHHLLLTIIQVPQIWMELNGPGIHPKDIFHGRLLRRTHGIL
jgi:hypothetical protein